MVRLGARLRAKRQRLHATRRSRQGPTPGRPLRQARLDQDPHALRPTRQSAAAQGTRSYRVRWVVDQAEFATDLLFKSPAALTGLYQKLLSVRRPDLHPQGHPGLSRPQVGSPFRRRRADRSQNRSSARHPHQASHDTQLAENVRQVRPNSAGGNRHQPPPGILRLRTRHHRDGTTSQGYFPMNKDVGSLGPLPGAGPGLQSPLSRRLGGRRRSRSGVPGTPTTHRTQSSAQRSSAGFNPARREDVRLFAAVLDGDHIARGFRNQDIRAALLRRRRQSDRKPECRGRPTSQTPAPASVGGEDPANSTLAGHGKRSSVVQ